MNFLKNGMKKELCLLLLNRIKGGINYVDSKGC